VYTLDTNTIIYYQQGDSRVSVILEDLFSSNRPIYVSAVTEAELFRFSNLTQDEASRIDAFLRSVSVIPVDSRIARLSGAVGRKYAVKLAGSIIAATALFTGSAVLTRNVRDFRRIEGLRVEKI
jgi:hypothetical protein